MKNKYFINLLLINTHSFSMQEGDVLVDLDNHNELIEHLNNPNEETRCNKCCNKFLQSCNLKICIYIFGFCLFVGIICTVIFKICNDNPNSNFCNPSNNVTPVY